MAEGDGRTEQQEEREEKGQEEGKGELEDGKKEEGVEQRRRKKRGKEVEIPQKLTSRNEISPI